MKRFNGQKMSHGVARRSRQVCPICSTPLIRYQGVLRCTEMRRSKGRSGGNDVRVTKHGSLDTIRSRMKRADRSA